MTATTISSGTSGYRITHGNSLIVDAGATSSLSIIGGSELVARGGFSDRDYVESRGSATIYGSASDTVVRGAGTAVVSSGGALIDGVIEGIVELNSGLVIDTVVKNGGELIVSAGGIASEALVENAGGLIVSAGGIASDVSVNNGGGVDIQSGGSVVDLTVDEGAFHYDGFSQINVQGGTLTSVTLSADGTLFCYSGLAAHVIVGDGAVAYAIGDSVNVGTLSGVFIRSEGVLKVSSGSHVDDLRVSGGGVAAIYWGTVDDADVLSGGNLRMDSKAATISGLTIEGGGVLFYKPGSKLQSVRLDPGAYLGFLEQSDSAVISGEVLDVLSQGHVVQSFTLVDAGGLGLSMVSASTLVQTEFVVTSGGSSTALQSVALAQSLAGFGTPGALAGSTSSHSGVASALFQMARPSQAL